nr:S8 family peptidase [Membranihabitans marinus]
MKPLLFLFIVFSIPLSAQTWEGYLFTLSPGHNINEVESYLQKKNINIRPQLIANSIRAYHLDSGELSLRKKSDSTIETILSECSVIDQWQRNYRMSNRKVTPNDAKYDEQWYLEKIKMPDAWEFTTGEINSTQHHPVIGVIEAGVTTTQPEFEGIFYINPHEIINNGIDDDQNGWIDDISGWNFNANIPQHAIDYSYHGDAVIGVMAAKSNNNTGIAGINWDPQIMLVSLEDRATNALTIQAYEYLYQARKRFNETNGQQGAFVVVSNSSFGEEGLFASDVPLFCEMYNKMGSVGILSVGATTNSESNVDNFGDIPSDCPSDQLVIVTSIDQTEDIRGGFGKINVDLGAPGTEIPTVYKDDEFLLDAGTSFSAPQVAAIISLAYSLPLDSLQSAYMNSPIATADEIKDCILSTVQPSAELELRSSSGGILDAAACLACVSEKYKRESSSNELKITNLYPNVANEYLKFTFSGGNSSDKITYSVIDYIGKIIIQDELGTVNNDYQQIDIKTLPAGGYFLRIEQGKSQSSWKFIKM